MSENSTDSFFEEDGYEENDEEHFIPLPPKDLTMPEFISDDTGIFVPPMLDSIDFSDLENDNIDYSAPESPTKLPLFSFPKNDIFNDGPCIDTKDSNSGITNNKSNLTLPSFNIENSSQKDSKISLMDKFLTEEYSMTFNLPLNSTKQQILDKIRFYSIHSFAKTNFRKHHLPSFNMKYYNIDDLISYSDKPLYKMLLKKVPDEKKELGKAISYIILRYAKVIESDNYDCLPGSLVSALRENNDAIDEAFFQLIKYSNNCPDRNVLAQVWKLWLIIGSLFPVSEDSRPYIFGFLIRVIYKLDDPLGEIPRSQSNASIHTNKNTTPAEFESNDDIKNSAKTGNSIYQTDITFTNFAKFVFMRMFERTFKIGLIYTKDMTKEAFMNMPKIVRLGRSMFSCSVYEVVWCQKRFYPLLPIPLPLYLIINQIKKNGGLLTPEFLVLKNRPESRAIMNNWIDKLPFDNTILNDGEINELIAILFYLLYNATDSIIPKLSSDMFIEKCQSQNYQDIFGSLPSLHLNMLKYLVGFFQETISFEQYNKMTKDQIGEIFSKFFVETHSKIIEPFKRYKMNELCNDFIVYCIDNLDCTDIYPLNPEWTKRVEPKLKKPQTAASPSKPEQNAENKKDEENQENNEKNSDEDNKKVEENHKSKKKNSDAAHKKAEENHKSKNSDADKNKDKSKDKHKEKHKDKHKEKTKDKHKDKKKAKNKEKNDNDS